MKRWVCRSCRFITRSDQMPVECAHCHGQEFTQVLRG